MSTNLSVEKRSKKSIIANLAVFLAIAVPGYFICQSFGLPSICYFAVGAISMIFDVEDISFTKNK